MECDDAFKESFKYYKSKSMFLNMNDVVDFESDDLDKEKIQPFHPEVEIPQDILQEVGLSEINRWKAYTVKEIPGLIFIRNPFTVIGQRYWVARSCRDFPKKPSKTNLDDLMTFRDRDWWTVCQRVDKKYLNKLRWSTFGHHHNWNTKVYSEDNKCPFPQDLAKLAKAVASYVGYPQFEAQAAIVNYYYMDSSLSGHTDHSELNLEAPLISLSFGNTAIFLIGGKTKSTRPHALYINSGDIVIMSGESRLFYHGVPKIVNNDKNSYVWIVDPPSPILLTEQNQENGEDDVQHSENKLMEISKCGTLWGIFFIDYIMTSRININIRQVLP